MNAKRTMIVAIAIFAGLATLRAAPTGGYNAYLGWGVGTNATANLSQFIGAEAGAGAKNALASGFYGVSSGASSESASCVEALGYLSLYGSKSVSDVLVAGYGAGYGMTNVADCVFIGRGAGYGANNVTGRVDICGLVYADKASGVTRIGSGGGEIACSDGMLCVADSAASIGFKKGSFIADGVPVGWVLVTTPYHKFYNTSHWGIETATSKLLSDGTDFVTKKMFGSFVAFDRLIESVDEIETDEETGDVYTNTVNTVVGGVMTLKATPTSDSWHIGTPSCNEMTIVSRDYVDRGDSIKIVGSYDAETNYAILGPNTNTTTSGTSKMVAGVIVPGNTNVTRTLTFATGASSGLKITVTGGGDAVTVTIGE